MKLLTGLLLLCAFLSILYLLGFWFWRWMKKLESCDNCEVDDCADCPLDRN
jgi:hypothetical protein